MNRTTKIGVVALLLLYAVASPVYVLFGYPRAFGSVARGLVIASVVLGLVTGVIGIWLWNRARPGEELRLLPVSLKRRLVALLGMVIIAIGGYTGNLVWIPIGFAIVALAEMYKGKQDASANADSDSR